MEKQSIKLSRQHPAVKKLLADTYPDYTGRKISVVEQNKYYMEDSWQGGSRSFVKAWNLATNTIAENPVSGNGFNAANFSNFEIPDGFAMVEHRYFCGHDLGIRICVNSNTFPKMLN